MQTDLKKLALLGIIGGMAVSSQAFSGDMEGVSAADEPKTEVNGCNGTNGCAGVEVEEVEVEEATE